jgi:iduronate 2-sulfatase
MYVDDTAVLLHGDHGYHLGEYGQWKKNTNWEECVKTPLIVKVPWLEGTAGTHTSALAELIDIMPTLADLAGTVRIGLAVNVYRGVVTLLWTS